MELTKPKGRPKNERPKISPVIKRTQGQRSACRRPGRNDHYYRLCNRRTCGALRSCVVLGDQRALTIIEKAATAAKKGNNKMKNNIHITRSGYLYVGSKKISEKKVSPVDNRQLIASVGVNDRKDVLDCIWSWVTKNYTMGN